MQLTRRPRKIGKRIIWEIKEILKTVDHTFSPASTWSEIKEILDDAMKYEQQVQQLYPWLLLLNKGVLNHVNGTSFICTCYRTEAAATATKARDKRCNPNGASEIDMVTNIGDVKDGLMLWKMKLPVHEVQDIEKSLSKQRRRRNHQDVKSRRKRIDIVTGSTV